MTHRSAESPLRCVVCQRGDHTVYVHLCLKCSNKHEVRSYCSRCHGRTSQEPEMAQKLFAQLQDNQLRAEELEAGMVIHFLDYCASCRAPGEPPVYRWRLHQLPSDED